MKPADITYDMVLEALKKSAEWVKYTHDGVEHGFTIDAETLVLAIHGYEHSMNFAAKRASRDEAVKKLAWSSNPRVDAPTPGQVTKVRDFAKEIVERGLAERVEYGNSVSFRWITPEMRAARDIKAALQEHMRILHAGFAEILKVGPDSGCRVETKLNPRHMQRGVFDGVVVLTLDEKTANKVLAALRMDTRMYSDD